MVMPAFTWGAAGQKLTPAQAKARRDVANALLANNQAATTFGGGLAKIGDALKGIHYERQADEAEQAGAESRKAIMDALIGNADPTMTDIYGALGDQWVASDPASSAILQAMMAQEMQENDPLRQLQIEGARLGNEAAALELDMMRDPPPPAPEYAWQTMPDGTLIRTDKTTGTVEPMGQFSKPEEATSAIQNYEYLVGAGIDPAKAQELAFGGGGTTINNMGNIPAGYAVEYDEQGRPVSMSPVPGSPAAIAAEQAAAAQAAQEGAQITSDIEGAEKTLMSTRNVLDILDNSDQPTTGTLSRPFAMLSNTPAGRIRSYVSTLQSGVALGAMQRLKEASSTGATGFGALSAPELNLLISDIGALDPDNTEPDIFRETVQRIEDRAKRVVADIRKNVSPERIQELGLQEFLDAFDPPNQSQAPQTGNAADPRYQADEPPADWGGDPALWRFMSPEDRALWK